MKLHIRGWGRGALAVFTAAAALCALAACQSLLNIDSDRHVATPDTGAGDETIVPEASDERETAAPPPGPWDCVNNPSEMPGSNLVDISVLVTDPILPSTRESQVVDGGSDLQIVSATYWPNVQITPCQLLDVPCAHPLAPTQTTDDAGTAHFMLPNDFGGFFRFSNPQLLPYILYPGKLPLGAVKAELPLAALSWAEAMEITSFFGVFAPSFDAGSGDGVIFGSVYDCHDHFAAGVQFHLSEYGPQTEQFYAVGTNASSASISTTATETDVVGAGGFVNVPMGSVTVSATVNLPGAPATPIGSTTVAVVPAGASEIFFRVRTH